MSLRISPITFKEAKEYVDTHHRHHSGAQGCKFCISVYENDRLCGVAMCGRPVARRLDNGYTLEINRVCTDGTSNACSKLYGACVKIAKDMGYKKVITYILQSEDGASVKASGFTNDGTAGGIKWTGERDRGAKNTTRTKDKVCKIYRKRTRGERIMSETLHEIAVRMSGNRCGSGCDGCPANVLRHGGNACLVRRFAQIDNADEQFEGLKKWAEEHPKKTYKSVFLDSFPNAPLNSEGVPVICRIPIFGDSVGNCDYHCADCWNSEVDNDVD